MEVVDSTLKVAHEAVDISYSGVGGGVLGDQHQRLTVVLQSLVVLSAQMHVSVLLNQHSRANST